MRKSIKKVIAIGVSVALLATTMVGALADLSTYPAPFVDDNGVFNGAIVVGETAATSDVLGAIDIAASLQADAKSAVAVDGGTVSVEGGKEYDNQALAGVWPNAGDISLKENKLNGFVDSSFKVGSDTIDYHDEIMFANATTHLNPATGEDADGNVYATVDSGAITYKLFFEDDVTGATSTHTANFKFLGQSIDGYDFNFTSGHETFTILSSVEKTLVEGDTVTVDGHTVELYRVGSTNAIIIVDGDSKVVNVNTDGSVSPTTYAAEDDFQVDLTSVFYIDGASDNIANVKLGETLEKTITPNAPVEQFGQPSVDADSDADWKWIIGNDGSNDYIGIQSQKDYETFVINDPTTEKNPLLLGDKLSLPNDYAALQFEALTSDYSNLDIALKAKTWLDDGETSGHSGYYATIKLSADSDYFTVDSNSASEVYIAYPLESDHTTINASANATVWYVDGSNEWLASSADFTYVADSDAIEVDLIGGSVAGDAINLVVQSPVGTPVETLTFAPTMVSGDEFDYFGPNKDAESGDLNYTITAGTEYIGNEDWSYMTNYGIVIDPTSSQLDNSKTLTLQVPSDDVTATYVVSSTGSSVSSSTSGSAYTVNPIEVGMGMLDSEATLGSKPMIVIGGPYANTVAKELLGFPTAEEIAQTFTEGKAMIKWFEDDQAMLVAGWSAQDTRGASYVVADYGDYDFTGNELEVVVTDLKNINVVAK